ncbi:NAD-glutamate dehydrogenase [Croceicoccus sp. F390]|uniref:NAD-glutamate dehydrogenase n=1 Tax=Croceicoccus esteveae TaxID=3075597 RepID=A0ABU2ZGJ6_9SPHN|nr:NAD-glutamate dehydrogenase domain-containing protein [Croceicoccus sp. F390]MDT0575707.1 NAD-glutamate dehydrogenase [Croceicoccus sp. F390]
MAVRLGQAITRSMLAGEPPMDAADLEEAAGFLLDTAASRPDGDPAIAIATGGDGRRVMRIGVINDDMPFLVDSLASTVAAQGLVIDRLVHPVVGVERDRAGLLVDVGMVDAERLESMIYIETPRQDARQRRELERAIAVTVRDVRAAVQDWPRMRAALAHDATRINDEEGAELLRWLGNDMMTQLGHVTRYRDGSHAEALGICRKSATSLLADASYERAFRWFDDARQGGGARAPLIVKSNLISNVHRRVPIDLFIVPVMRDGTVAALSVHAGIWTSTGLNVAPDKVPRMRQQLARLMDRLGFRPGGHTGKSLQHALTALPHDLVIGFSDADVERVATTMISLVDRPRPRVALVEAPLARHLFAFVWLPRDMLSTRTRTRIQALLEEEADASVLDWSLQVEGGALAMIRYVLDIREGRGRFDEASIDQALQAMLRGWSDAVEAELAQGEDAGRAAALATRFAEAFPMPYRASYGAAEAAVDIRRVRRLHAGEARNEADEAVSRDARLYRLENDPVDHLRMKIYQHDGNLPLSDAVPALENFGFTVLSEMPTLLDKGTMGTIHDFTLALPPGENAAALLDRAQIVEAAVAAVLNHVAENDVFNRLIISASLQSTEADWLRAIYRYLRQAGISFTIYTVVDALGRAPSITRALIDLFRARHDPMFEGDRDTATDEARETIRSALVEVAAINDDRLLRLYQAMIEAVLRTNAFAPTAAEALAFKIDSAQIPGLPRPIPWREIFVYSRRVEGIHLRAGPVARGGLRWSDRRDDFRTEVLGLMKAQRVKNAVIVPTGAKGGFYPKQLPDPARDRAAWAAEGQASYEIFIRTLLAVTDNIIDDAVVHPDGVVIHDGDDPYFVVAADKGTARFSDVANAIAEAHDFWLDDAFASGGSNGYDHKAMGITARGAWMSVQRHFREMGVDVQTDSIDVVGCGDMSGDVFGNGMLLSQAIRLVAAFDHRHIFIDPAPDPAASWQERKRLFDLPHSSWADYDAGLISAGGGVFSRADKRITLSKQAQEALGIDCAQIEPDALISAILRAPVDLLWFGGIGTYIKATVENNVQVGDTVNDALRVNGGELRARVVGEGANLGVTQAGRIEYALSGGRINADFIDNSAGVDCSDNEVNIKIALAAACRAGALERPARNILLEEMTDKVAALVLDDNRLQALALSIASLGGAPAAASYTRVMELLEDMGSLDRRTEGLADGDVLARRATEGKGLTRPELAVLLSSSKLVLQSAIEASDVPDDPTLLNTLLAAFPPQMQEQYPSFIATHRLRRQIIATSLANRIVNRLGIVLPFELAEEEGADLAQVTSAFVVAEQLLGLDAIWQLLDHAEMPEAARLLLFDQLAIAVRSHMADLLRAGAGRMVPSRLHEQLAPGFSVISDETENLLEDEARRHSRRLRERLAKAGAPEAAAGAVSHVFEMDGAVGIADLAASAGMEPRRLTAAFTGLGARLGLDWAQGMAAIMSPSDPWERLLVAGLARDFQQMRLIFLKTLCQNSDARTDPADAMADWAATHEAAIRRFRAVVGRAQASVPVSPAVLAQIASQARNLLAR